MNGQSVLNVKHIALQGLITVGMSNFATQVHVHF